MNRVTDLAATYNGPAYVVGSGPTLTHIDPFVIAPGRDDVIICVNDGGVESLHRPPDYLITQHPEFALALLDKHPDTVIVAMDHNPHGRYDLPEHERLYTWTPEPTTFDWAAWDPARRFTFDTLFWGTTSAPAALQFACLLGCNPVIAVGLDCALLDGQSHVNGYDGVIHDLELWNRGLDGAVAILRENYGTTIHSLNPFVNLNLEGHQLQRSARR